MNPIYLELILQLISILGLLLFNALLVTCEFSLIKLRFSHFNQDALDQLKQNKSLGALLDHADVTVKVVRLGIISCTIGYGILLFPIIENYFSELAIFGFEIIDPISIAISFTAAVCLHYLVGELVPRGLALHYPARALKSSAWAVKIIEILTKPLIRILTRLSRIILKIFKVEPGAELETLDIEAQLQSLGEDVPTISPVTQKTLRNTLELHNRTVQDIILPRNQVQVLDLNDSIDQNIELAKRSGHTRFPLCEGDLDQCIGIVHIKDIFRSSGNIKNLNLRRIKRNIIRVMPEESLDDVMQKLMHSRTHMALVLDEFGGITGVITLEGIIETIVGSIQDEFDFEEEHIKPVKVDEYLVSGLTPIHEFEEALSVEVENKEVATVGGLITSELGRIPVLQEKLRLNGLDIAITEVNEKRVIAARVRVFEREGEEKKTAE